MKKILMLAAILSVIPVITACKSSSTEEGEGRWSKPQRVLEGCDGVMSNSQQCQKNPTNQQMMIQIDRN